MPATNLGNVFLSTRETLAELGLDDDFYLDLVAARLVVERVGESDNLDWWESLVLTETGRARLEEVTPKTAVKARIDLARKVGAKVEQDRLPEDSISLFSFGPRLESRLEAAIDEIEAGAASEFNALEDLSVTSVDKGWADPLIQELQIQDSTTGDIPNSEPSGAIRLDEEGFTQQQLDEIKQELLVTFLRGYGTATTEPLIPYYPLESEIEPDLA